MNDWKATRTTAAVAEVGNPSASIGTKTPAAFALFAASGPATPSIAPLPNSSLFFDKAFGAPVMADVALTIQPAGYLSLIILAFTTVGTLLGASRIRGLVALSVGLVIGLVGADLQSGALRLTFGNNDAIRPHTTCGLVWNNIGPG